MNSVQRYGRSLCRWPFSSGRRKLLILLGLSVSTLLYAGALLVRADDKVKILTISSQTADLVTFQISSPKHAYNFNEDIVIRYTARNNSRKTIYLVTEPKLRLSADQKNNSLKLESPVKFQDEFTQYDNDLIKILPRKAFSGELIVKGNEIPRDKEYEAEEWDVEVGFSYVFDPSSADISELLACKNTKYSFPCLGRLFKLAKTVNIGKFVIEVKNH